MRQSIMKCIGRPVDLETCNILHTTFSQCFCSASIRLKRVEHNSSKIHLKSPFYLHAFFSYFFATVRLFCTKIKHLLACELNLFKHTNYEYILAKIRLVEFFVEVHLEYIGD